MTPNVFLSLFSFFACYLRRCVGLVNSENDKIHFCKTPYKQCMTRSEQASLLLLPSLKQYISFYSFDSLSYVHRYRHVSQDTHETSCSRHFFYLFFYLFIYLRIIFTSFCPRLPAARGNTVRISCLKSGVYFALCFLFTLTVNQTSS